MAGSFLTAVWSELAMLHYAVPPEVLFPLLPPGCDLVLNDGHATVSLVGLNFSNTVVRGISWPGYRNFPEVNLRFYVRQGDRRGVVFVREMVPLRAVAWLARLAYNEPYRRVPMTSHRLSAADQLTVDYTITHSGRTFSLHITADPIAHFPPADSDDFRLTDQRWGFGTTRRGKLLSYRVDHAPWLVHRVQSFNLDWDWATIYGPQWAFLQSHPPQSLTLAAGSPVQVSPWASPNEKR